jgi:MFS family permease
MLDSDDGVPVREVRDMYGRRYRVGETDVDLMGRSRAWMICLSWASMVVISLFQYGFAAAIPALTRTNGWSLREAFVVLAVWVVFQSGFSLPAVWLYRRMGNRVVGPMLVGAALCLVALLTLAHARNVAAALLGYSVLGGIGASIVYMTSVATVTAWFPERVATRVGAVSGAFGYGAVPFVIVAAYAPDIDKRVLALDCTAAAVFVVIGISGILMRKPPKNWWPAHIDPQAWALDRRLNRSVPNNMPAMRPYPPRAAVQSGMLPVMFLIVVLAAAIAFFDIAYLAGFAQSRGFQPLLVVASVGVLAVSTGCGRAAASSLSDRLGRRPTLGLALALGGVTQFGLLVAAQHNATVMIVVFAGLAGAGTGATYPLLLSLVRDWFGNEATLPNYGIVYMGKAAGALVGVGLAGLVVATAGSSVAFVVAGCLGLFGAALTRRMRQPGHPALPVPSLLRVDRV